MFRLTAILMAGWGAAPAVTLRLGLPADFGKTLGDQIDFAEVVEVQVDGARIGSGVFLAEHWILTAAHVVEGGRSAVVRSGGRELAVSGITLHPGWTSNPATGYSQGADLALLRLEEGRPGVPIIPLWTGGFAQRPLAMMAGYGAGGNGLLGAYQPANGLQAGLNLADRFVSAGAGGFWITDFDSGASQHNSLNEATVDQRYFDLAGQDRLTPMVFGNGEESSSAGFAGLTTGFGEVFPEATTARGDSGGPLFLYNEVRQRWELAGVTSFGVNPLYPAGFNRGDSRYGDLSFFADVSGQGDWLASVMIPEGSTALLSLGGGLLLLSRRRRGAREGCHPPRP